MPPEFVARLADFWEWRLSSVEAARNTTEAQEEADGLFWFVSTPHIGAADTIRLGRRNVQLLSAEHHNRGFVWDRIGELAAEDPTGAFDIAEALVMRGMRAKFAYLPFDKVAPALRAALASQDAGVRERAKHLIDMLGERGFVDYGVLLKDVPTE